MRGKILLEAMKIINGERQDAYGNPEDSFLIVSGLWNVYLDTDVITERDVAIMMALFKIARYKQTKKHWDSILDSVGYLALASEMED